MIYIMPLKKKGKSGIITINKNKISKYEEFLYYILSYHYSATDLLNAGARQYYR